MRLIARLRRELLELGNNFNFETAYEFILEHDNDEENPWLEGYDLVLINETEAWLFEADCWVEVEKNV
jgi:hypothetical protein